MKGCSKYVECHSPSFFFPFLTLIEIKLLSLITVSMGTENLCCDKMSLYLRILVYEAKINICIHGSHQEKVSEG